MIQHEWRGAPTWWVVRSRLLKKLGGSTTGENIAALKVFLALVIASDTDRLAQVSYTRLGDLTGLSRPMVGAGLQRLRSLGVVETDTSTHRHTHRFVQEEGQVQFMKIPMEVVRAHLPAIPNSTQEALAALKIYVVLLTMRQRHSRQAPISHKALQKYTGIRPGLIAKGVSILIACDLVRFTKSPPRFNPAGYPVNNHLLYGKFLEGADEEEEGATGLDEEDAMNMLEA